MPRPPDNDWRSQQNTAPRGNARGSQTSGQARGGRRAVDSWRSYSNDTHTLQASISGRSNSNTGFDPYNQVFSDQASGSQNAVQLQTQSYCQPQITQATADVHYSVVPFRPESRWPMYDQDQTRTAPSHLRPYEPLRSTGTQERHQAYQSAPGGRGAHVLPTFTQHVPMRPSRGAEGPRTYATSRHQPVSSVEQLQFAPHRQPRGHDRSRAINSRQSTPRRDDATATPPPPPVATQDYLSQAHLEPVELNEPQCLLVILDLNGTLMLKPDYRRPNTFQVRPSAPKLLEYLFANHTVMVWTSAKPHNAEIVSQGVFSSAQYDMLAAIWARDKLDLTPEQYRAKVQVYKKLDKVWANNEVQSSFFPAGTGKWNQTNTILVDDSHLKALQEPHNLLQIIEFTGKMNGLKEKAYRKHEERICQSLITKLEVLKMQKDVSRLIWRWQTGKVEIPKVPGSNFFVDEKVDQKEQARKDLEAAMNMPTPESPATTDSEDSGGEAKGKVVTAPERNASQSPVDEAVFKDLLEGGNGKSGLPTPESQHGEAVGIDH